MEIVTSLNCIHTAQDFVGLHCCQGMLLPHIQLAAYLMAFSTELLPKKHKIQQLESDVSVITVSSGPVRQ